MLYTNGGIMLNAMRAWNAVKIIVVIYGVFLFVTSYKRMAEKIDKIHDVITSDCSYGEKK